MKRRSGSRAAGALLIAGVGGIAALVAVSPAVAATVTVETAGWEWVEIDDTTLGISDAVAYHRDVLGSGVVLKGWTEDAFDAYGSVNGYLSSVGFDHTDPLLSGSLLPVPVSFGVHPDGGATVVSRVEDYDLGGGTLLDAVVTLDVAGSFARWTIEVDDGGSGLVESIWGSGELGSPTAAASVGLDGLVVTGPSGLGPVIGFQVDSDGTSDEFDGSDPEFPTFISVGATTVVVTLALLDHDPCAEADAVAAMTALVPDLAAHFGEDLDPVLSDCVDVEEPAAMQLGSPTDQILALALDGALAGGHPRLDGETYFDYVDLWTSGLAVLAPDLPAGLTLEVAEDPVTLQPALRLSGMPIEAMTGDIPIRLYGIRNSPDFSGEMPVAATLELDIDALDIAAPDDPEKLAEAGVEPGPGLVVAGIAVVTGLVATALTRLPRRSRVE